MTIARIAPFVGGVLLLACSSANESVPRTISPAIVLSNTTRLTTPPPPGPFVSVIDSIVLAVIPETGPPIPTIGQHLSGYRTSATLQPVFPPGNTTFTADILSNTRVILFTGTVTQLITSDVASLPLAVSATKPVLLMVPDTAVTSTVTSTQFSVYNAGLGNLSWSVASVDTAFTRCGAACTFTPSSGTTAPGATATIRATVPVNFPTRRFSFVIRSPEGSVTVFWVYSGSTVSGVTVQPTASLHNIGQSFPLTASVQASGTTSTAVAWSSANTAVATVSPTGVVTGVQARATTVAAASVVDTAKKALADIRVYDSTATNAGFALVQPAAADTVRRDDTSAGSHSTVVLRALSVGTTSPQFSAVEFWVRPGATGAWRRVGQTTANVETTDGSGGRAWAWSFTWNPDATDAPFFNPSTIGVSIVAVGITATGQTIATPVNANVSVRVP